MAACIAAAIILLFVLVGQLFADPKGIDYFEKYIRPVLVERCYKYHSAAAKKLKGGLLDATMVLWGGEFGRPSILNQTLGCDHNARGFTMWMAVGGVKGGLCHGATDETGMTAPIDIVHLHDIHATLLHLIGMDHEKLACRYGGRDFRLTDVHGRVVKEILA